MGYFFQLSDNPAHPATLLYAIARARLGMGAEVRNHKQLCGHIYIIFPEVSADGHTASNAPDLF